MFSCSVGNDKILLHSDILNQRGNCLNKLEIDCKVRDQKVHLPITLWDNLDLKGN